MNIDTIDSYDANPRPYEKVMAHGASMLSDAELLAIILRTGTQGRDATSLSCDVLNACTGKDGIVGLCNMTIPELMSIKGIGKVKAIQIQAIVELARRLSKRSVTERKCLSNPQIIAEYYMQDMMHLEVEKVLLVILDNKCGLIHDTFISQGTVKCSVITPREIIIEAMKYKAVSIIILHNHPSGDPTPSTDDYEFTKRLKSATNIVGISLLDHIVIGNNKYISLKETGKF